MTFSNFGNNKNFIQTELSCFCFRSALICQFLELNTPTCYSNQTSLLKSSEDVDNQSYYIVRCSLTAHRKGMYQHYKSLFRNFGSKCEVKNDSTSTKTADRI